MQLAAELLNGRCDSWQAVPVSEAVNQQIPSGCEMTPRATDVEGGVSQPTMQKQVTKTMEPSRLPTDNTFVKVLALFIVVACAAGVSVFVFCSPHAWRSPRGLLKLHLPETIAGPVASTTPGLLIPSNVKHGVYINHMHVVIEDQNGVTANLNANVGFENDMAHSMNHNNNAASHSGNVDRVNGAFDNNAITNRGDVERVNGAMVTRNNGVETGVKTTPAMLDFVLKKKVCKAVAKGGGDVRRHHQQQQQEEAEEEEEEEEKEQLQQQQQQQPQQSSAPVPVGSAEPEAPNKKSLKLAKHKLFQHMSKQDMHKLHSSCHKFAKDSSPEASDADARSILDLLSDPAGKQGTESINASLQTFFRSADQANQADRLVRVLSWFHGIKAADEEERKEHILEVLHYLYGRKLNASSVDNEGNQAFFDFYKGVLANETGAMLSRSTLIHDVLTQMSSPSFSKLIKVKAAKLNIEKHYKHRSSKAEVAEIGELIRSLETPTSSKSNTKKGPVVIQNVDILMRHQNGFQANLEAGVRFRNDMSHTLHDNNNAVSKTGAVLRANGVFDNNAIAKTRGNVTRANGLIS